MTSHEEELPRVLRLGDGLADQIAAGEVVERPASVVKELVDNAIDAGATAVDVQLQTGGVASIVVVDDGHGIHPEDLTLSLTRHATSKLRRAADLTDIGTLGFRGEALASVAAVASVTVQSRRLGHATGQRARAQPGKPLRIEPVGMAVGTRIEVVDLFANVPARRKFLRSEATEVGHVSEAMVRLALVHPSVRFSLTHGRRTLLELAAAELGERVHQVLVRRGGSGTPRYVGGVLDGMSVRAWLMEPSPTTSRGASVLVVVRRRVVREANLAKIVAVSYGGAHAPVACLWVEPPAGEVDVNVHPQKAEIRFGDPQRVYGAVREVLATLHPVPTPAPHVAPPRSLADALGGWSEAAPGRPSAPGGSRPLPAYRLSTRATTADYAAARDQLREQASALGQALSHARTLEQARGAASTVAEALDDGTVVAEPTYLACLPGPVALFRVEDDLLAVDLRALRSHLVFRRLHEDLGGGRIAAQALLVPAVVSVSALDVALVAEHGDALAPLGVIAEPFGAEAIVVRAVPAQLRSCVEDPDVADLVRRVLPWLRVRARSEEPDRDAQRDHSDAMRAMASTAGNDPAPRLARVWLRELAERGEDLATVPGIVRWTAGALTEGA